MIRALIFDFDGLILETEEPIYQAWQEIFASYGCQLPFEKWAATIGSAEYWFDPIAELEQQTGRKLDRQELTRRQQEREWQLIVCQTEKAGVRDYLQAGRELGLKIGLASSSPCAWVEGHLKRLALREYFDCVLASDDVHRTKPDPALYLAALECLGVAGHEAVAFEDSPNGVLAAKRAGLWCVAVPNSLTRQLSLELADLQIPSLSELPLPALLVKLDHRR